MSEKDKYRSSSYATPKINPGFRCTDFRQSVTDHVIQNGPLIQTTFPRFPTSVRCESGRIATLYMRAAPARRRCCSRHRRPPHARAGVRHAWPACINPRAEREQTAVPDQAGAASRTNVRSPPARIAIPVARSKKEARSHNAAGSKLRGDAGAVLTSPRRTGSDHRSSSAGPPAD